MHNYLNLRPSNASAQDFAQAQFIENPTNQMPIARILLFPFAVLYNGITRFRNHLFNIGYTHSFEFDTHVISVGNLTVGGTGKTPMVEYLIRLLGDKYKISTLSRGYGRKTKGFRIATTQDTPGTIGDEPYQLFRKFGNIHVTVGEERALAIPEIVHHFPENEVILLDDAYQHRHVKPNLNILLTDFNRPFYEDFVLPAGRLREARSGAQRADVVVVTKCPNSLGENEMGQITERIANYKGNQDNIYFTTIGYDKPTATNERGSMPVNVLLFTGIANNQQLEKFVSEKYNLVKTLSFADHHDYTKKDVEHLKEEYFTISKKMDCALLTTEKDIVKLKQPGFERILKDIPLFYLPIRPVFLENGEVFDKLVLNSIQSNR